MARAFSLSFALFLLSGGNICTIAVSVLLMPIALFASSGRGLLRENRIFYVCCGVIAFFGIIISAANMLSSPLFAALCALFGILIAAKSKNAPAYFADLCMFVIAAGCAVLLFYISPAASLCFKTDLSLLICPSAFCIAYSCKEKRLLHTSAGFLLALPAYFILAFSRLDISCYAVLFLSPMLISCCLSRKEGNIVFRHRIK